MAQPPPSNPNMAGPGVPSPPQYQPQYQPQYPPQVRAPPMPQYQAMPMMPPGGYPGYGPPPKSGGGGMNTLVTLCLVAAGMILIGIIGFSAWKKYQQDKIAQDEEQEDVNVVLTDLADLDIDEAIRKIEEIEARPDSDFE